jgi:transcriptional regulator with GAF, ATPase, and Fis domain
MVMATGAEIEPVDLELETGGPDRTDLKSQLSQNQKDRVEQALEEHGYVISRATRALGVSRPSIYSMIRRYSISLPGR